MRANVTFTIKDGKEDTKKFEVLDLGDIGHHGMTGRVEKELLSKYPKQKLTILKINPAVTAIAGII